MSTPRRDYGSPLRIWDRGPDWDDRYTILPPRSGYAMAEWSRLSRYPEGLKRLWMGLSGYRYPLRSGDSTTRTDALPGPHLGRRITWAELPEDVQRGVRASFLGEYCPKVNP